jgi:phosphate transport system protein
MERHFDEELAGLKYTLIRMAGLTEDMIGDAMRMLVERDASVCDALNRHEGEVNQMQRDVDEICLKLIALHQPTASDLRFILGAIKTNSELERLADLAINILH